MGNSFLTFLITILTLISCSKVNPERNHPEIISVYDYLKANDSVGMWCGHYYNYYDIFTKKWIMSETVYCPSFFVYNDSLYQYNFPCFYNGAKRIYFHGSYVLTDSSDKKKVYQESDTLILEYTGSYFSDDSTKYLITETYIKKLFPTSEIMKMMNTPNNEGCDTTEYFRNKCLYGWDQVWIKSVKSFYE